MRDMLMDKTELGCLRAIVLFNPGACLALLSWPLLAAPLPFWLLFFPQKALLEIAEGSRAGREAGVKVGLVWKRP